MIKWRTIPGFSRYEASSDGHIRSTNYKNSRKTKVLKPAADGKGYLKTMLQRDDGGYCSSYVHKWMAITFIGERPQDYTVDHIDGNKQNNSADNLEYVTRSENMQRACDMGLMKPMRGELNGMSKLTTPDILEIREYVRVNSKFKSNGSRYGYGRKALAEKYGISEAHLKDVISQRRGVWSYV